MSKWRELLGWVYPTAAHKAPSEATAARTEPAPAPVFEMPGGGDWVDCCYPSDDSPYRHARVEIWRQEWQEPRVIDWRDMRPETNIAGLYWRPMY